MLFHHVKKGCVASSPSSDLRLMVMINRRIHRSRKILVVITREINN